MRYLRSILLLLGLCLLPGLSARSANLPKPKAEYVIVVSCDGFRWDYPEKYKSPTIDEMGRTGVRADMLPSFPASTFPNHYAIATGLVPDHNGLVNNSFWAADLGKYYSMSSPEKNNPAFYLGEPIWNTAERQGVKAGIHYWVASEYLIGGRQASYWKRYGVDMLSYEARVDSTLALLDKPMSERPRLLMLYFDEPDHTGHEFGPDDPRVGVEVRRVDKMVARLRNGLKKMGLKDKVDLIVLSDHGMTGISPDRCVKPHDFIKKSWYDRITTGAPTSIFTKNEACRDSVLAAFANVEHVSVYKKEEVPAELNYGTSPRIGDVVVIPECGWQLVDKPRKKRGAHGYRPSDRDMQAIFRAEGPDFKRGFRCPQFRNVSVYPLVCHLLGIEPAPNDGAIEEVAPMLR